MTQESARLDRAVEAVLTIGLVASALLLVAGLLLGAPGALRAGILLLLGTPAARVVVLTVGFLAERDWAFALVCLWILGVLGSSLWLALGWR